MKVTKPLVFLVLGTALFVAANRLSESIRISWHETGGISTNKQSFFAPLLPPWPPSQDHIDLAIGAAAVVILLFVWAYQAAGNKATRVGEEHGSARWGKPGDIHPFMHRPRQDNLLFTRTEALGLDTHRTQRNLNCLVIGGAGSGKSRYYVMPNLWQTNTSYAITDSKGELYAMAAPMLREAGYQVRTLNLIELGKSNTFNPLAYFSETQPAVDVLILTENIVTNTNGRQPRTGGDFWEKTERALLGALISYVYFTEGPEGTLNDVTTLLAAMRASEADENAISNVDAIFLAVEEEIANFQRHPGQYDAEAAATIEGLTFSASQYNTYTQGAGETKKSIIISLAVRLAPLQIPEVQRLLTSDTIAAHRIGTEKTALFLILPDTHQAFSFLAAVFYEILFEQNMRLADQNGKRRLDVPVQCFMDEFANIGLIPSFERKIAVMRSRGISASIICQTYAQGKALYKDDWETIVGNCDSTLFLGGSEPSTTKFFSERLGKETIHTTDTSESRGTSGSWSKQSRKLARDLMTQDELARLPTDECIYLLRGLPAFRSRKLATPKDA